MTMSEGNKSDGVCARRDGHIRILPIHVANKIAAGEVVERPASALKELVENAIDAGADRIDITVTAGGKKLVAVRDNGCGMGRDDALLSLERQATSKIRDVDDIERIDTLGFRGEAIPSIAAVSRFTLTTRERTSDAGTRLVVNAGLVAEVAECGAPPGTCVEVRDLFCNVPARKKFLRSYATEEGHIKSVFTVCSLAHPELGFSLTIDGREIHRLAPGSTLEERISALFGRDFADELLPVTGSSEMAGTTSGDVHIHGYVSRPSPNPIRREQFVFVNGRPATAPIIAYALKEAYPSSAGESRPSVFLFIDLPPSEVDVNVHPAKREVRFRHPADVKSAIVSAMGCALKGLTVGRSRIAATSDVGSSGATTASASRIRQDMPPVPFSAPFQPTLNAHLANAERHESKPDLPISAQTDERLTPVQSVAASLAANTVGHHQAASMPAASTGPWRTFKVLANTESGYIILETDAGIVTLNPQAAEERVAYEKLLPALDSEGSVSQRLLIPETIRLSPLESARLKSFSQILVRQGFEIEEFGTDTWKIDAVPPLLADRSASDVIASVVHDIGECGTRRGERWREELIARSIAKTYAGTSRRFTVETATRLVEELCRTRMPYVCPRGKPVMIFTSNRELSRKFGDA